MKKRMVGLLLSLSLSFGLFGCGNNAEVKQEQDETGQEDSEKYNEFEYF